MIPNSSPHWHDKSSVSSVMMNVVLALVPGLFLYVWFFGWGILIQCLLAIVAAIVLEYLVLRLRGRDTALYLKDGSAVVTALLLALTLSPLAPWWIVIIGVAFAIIIAKHLFGGIGYNLFNPAMAGYCFVLLCFPAQMNVWQLPSSLINDGLTFTDSIRVILSGTPDLIDAITGATPLNDMKSQIKSMGMVEEIRTGVIYGHFSGVGWDWISFGWMLGGIYLLIRGFIKWQIPVAVLASVFLLGLVMHLYDPDVYASAMFHLCAGGTIFCAFFIATDPVTAATTNKGRIIYGCMIGVLIYVIRVWGGYPDGVAFAVLLANSLVPYIDARTSPRVFGESK